MLSHLMGYALVAVAMFVFSRELKFAHSLLFSTGSKCRITQSKYYSKYSKEKTSFSSSILGAGATQSSLFDIENYILQNNLFSQVIGKKAKLLSHPGFALSTGCNSWKFSGFTGSVQAWSAAPYITWFSSSVMSCNEMDSLDIDRPYFHRDINIFPSNKFNLPGLKISISEFRKVGNESSFHVLLDYVPREDILSSYFYYDKYFKGLDEELYHTIKVNSEKGLLTQSLPDDSVLARLLTSAFAIHADFTGEGASVVEELCKSHIDRWCRWLVDATELDDDEKIQRILDRDTSIQKYQFIELKFSLARILGSSFAPKAEDIAATIIGPVFQK